MGHAIDKKLNAFRRSNQSPGVRVIPPLQDWCIYIQSCDVDVPINAIVRPGSALFSNQRAISASCVHRACALSFAVTRLQCMASWVM